MNELIKYIESMSFKLIEGDKATFAEMTKTLNVLLWTVFPKIIIAYSYPELGDYSSDATLWPAQLQKILESLASNDTFRIVDTLYFETRTMLLEFEKILYEKNIVIE